LLRSKRVFPLLPGTGSMVLLKANEFVVHNVYLELPAMRRMVSRR
jgi:hypothetical protein